MAMTRRLTMGSALLGGLASACSPLRTFSVLTPKDGGVRQIARGLAYGPDERQALDAYAPTNGGGRTLVVFVYGGSWNSGSRAAYGWAGRALAAQGFTVIVPDYRLSPEVRFPSFVEDVAAAVARARAEAPRWGADPERIVLAGHSAGAHIALLLALDRRRLEQAGVPADAVRGTAGLAGPYDFLPFEPGGAAEAALGSAPDLRQTQPIAFARGDGPPLWLATGDGDTTVRPRNSLALAEAVRKLGGQAETKLYPGLGHVDLVLALSRPFRGKAPVLADLADFIRRVG